MIGEVVKPETPPQVTATRKTSSEIINVMGSFSVERYGDEFR
jgi:hypothetical protein